MRNITATSEVREVDGGHAESVPQHSPASLVFQHIPGSAQRSQVAWFRAIAAVACAMALSETVGCNSVSRFVHHQGRSVEIDSVPSALSAIRESRDPTVRRDAFSYLGDPSHMAGDNTRRDEISHILALAVVAEADPDLRVTILRSLARLGSANGIEAIEDAASDKDPVVRAAVCRLLGRTHTQNATQKLDALLVSDPNLDVRLAAADALSNLPSREAAMALLSGIEDADVAVRFRCRESLKKLVGKDHAGDLAGWRQEIQTANFEQSAGQKKWFGVTF